MYEKYENYGGCIQIESSVKTDFDNGLLEILPKIEGVKVDPNKCRMMLREISLEQARILLTTGFRRGLAYSSNIYMSLFEAKALAGEFLSSFPEGSNFYTHCSIPPSVEGDVSGWTGRITGATVELSVYVVSRLGCTLLLITDED